MALHYKCCMRVCMLSRLSSVQLPGTLWTVAHQAPLSMEFSSKNTGVGCRALLQGTFLTQGSNARLSLARTGGFFTSATWEAHKCCVVTNNKKTIYEKSEKKKRKIRCHKHILQHLSTWLSTLELKPSPVWVTVPGLQKWSAIYKNLRAE